MKHIYRIVILITSLGSVLFAHEPIKPIPQHLDYNKEKAELGKLLFVDPRLSSDGTVACVSCHSFDHGGADPRPVSIGVRGSKGCANAPTVYNSYFNFRQFWNGRAKDLKEQANGPIHNPVEMDMVPEKIEKYLKENKYYRSLFKKVFKNEPKYDYVLDAIAEFEKALFTPNCKFDQYLRNETKLSPKEAKGYRLFKMFGCITCHNGVNIGGNSFQKFGLIFSYEWKSDFPDRYAITKKPQDKNVYKVPTLRNIVLTSPYLHDGSAATLQEVLQKMSYHNLGFDLNKEEIDALVAFMKTLTGEVPKIIQKK
ncbi:cytochrome-c peroxidase [Hydrogenimonas thermophila]|uniref:Cytochrome c peroxidase n=1 Tax=Hydrogenimonas thermophila TaxID=223786 RepID=A0A1I5S249_9BACT|nr:cytochrome c peroxidase [Hydrogenimonas thermophila]SFP64661.1 cytochrome c peroxidase [Hydrogenimonas thermophila]